MIWLWLWKLIEFFVISGKYLEYVHSSEYYEDCEELVSHVFFIKDQILKLNGTRIHSII